MDLINESIQRKDNLLKQLKILSEKYNLYIVGAGRYGNVLGKWLNQNGVKWSGYLDRSKDGRTLNGKQIFDTFGAKNERDFYVISSYLFKDEMKADLVNQGISEIKIISPSSFQLLLEIYEDTDNWRKYTKKNKLFFRCHESKERCFIVGNGPSLKIEDLEMLKNEITFASNTIYAVYKNTNWRPNYYYSLDSFMWETLSQQEILEKILSGCDAAFTSLYGNMFQMKDNKEFEKLHYVIPIAQINEVTHYPLFSEDCSDVVFKWGTITYVMIQMAVYMGFKTIYLLGVDFTFSHEMHADNSITINNINSHMEQIEKEQERFYEVVKKIYGYGYMAKVDAQKEAYMSANRYAKEHGIKILNATRGGKLEVFERVDFDTLFADK